MKNLLAVWNEKYKILAGVANRLLPDQNVERIAALRQEICRACPAYDGDCLVPGSGPCCGDCGCSLGFKTRSLLSACPQGHWPAVTDRVPF
jgi:hypothetical protein